MDENTPVPEQDKLALEAHLALSRTPESKTLSWKEKEKVAEAVLTGNIGAMKTPSMKEALVATMVSLGVSPDYLAAKIKEGLEADETKFFAHQGIVGDAREVVNWTARHSYLRTALKVLGVSGDASAVKVKTFVYKPQLRGAGETVQIELPKDELLRRRMAAAKANSRGLGEPE